MYLQYLAPLIPSVEKIMNIQWVYVYQPRDIFVLPSRDEHNDIAGHFTVFEKYNFKNSVQ
jgi:hypothetical protein